jgi:hypothetical protein
MDMCWDLDSRGKFARGFIRREVSSNHVPHLHYQVREVL